jgi:quercetin dioxygenase-like cupin family protein
MTTIVSRKNAPYYKWPSECEGWRLVDTPELSVEEEMFPPGAMEEQHYHKIARQFFYLVDGAAHLQVEGKKHQLRKGQGFEVDPGVRHKIINQLDQNAVLLVVSAPSAKGDRVVV